MKTILLVEDDLLTAKLLQIILTRLGNHQVIVTEDVHTILEFSRSGKVDLIIMDIFLNKSMYEGYPVDGLQLTKLIKDNPLSKDIPVILASAHLLESNGLKTVHAAGADDYLLKPLVDHQILIQKVNQWMKVIA